MTLKIDLQRKIYVQGKGLDNLTFRVLSIFVFALPLFIIPGTFFYIPLAKMVLLKITASIFVLGWVYYAVLTKRIRWGESVINLPFFLFVFAIILSVIFSANPLVSLASSWGKRFEELPTWFAYIIVFVAALSYQGKFRKREIILKALVSGSVVASLHGIFQRFGYDFLKLGWAGQMRSSAFLGNPILLGGYLSMVIPIALGLTLTTKHYEEKIFWGMACGLASLTLIFTLSRGAWIGAAVGMVVFIVILAKGRARQKQALVAVLVIAVVSFLGYFLVEAVKSGSSPVSRIEQASTVEGSLATRFSIWRSSLEMISERPWQGWGFENFRNHFSQYREEVHVRYTQGRVLPDRPHNQLIYISFATGVLGLLSYLWLVIAISWRAIQKIAGNWSHVDKKRLPIMGSMIAGAVAYLVQEQFSFSLPAVTSLFWILAGLSLSSSVVKEEESRSHRNYITIRPIFLTAIGVIIAIVLSVSALAFVFADFNYYQGLRAYNEQVNLIEAEKWLKKAISFNPLKGEYRLSLGRVYHRLAYQTENPVWIKKAIRIYKKGISYDPDSPNLYLGLGEAYYADSFIQKKKDYTLARNALVQGLTRLPYSEDGRVLLAESLIQEGNLDEALRQLSFVLKYSPSDFRALYNMGIVFEKRGEFPFAVSYYRRALQVNPNSRETRARIRRLEMLVR